MRSFLLPVVLLLLGSVSLPYLARADAEPRTGPRLAEAEQGEAADDGWEAEDAETTGYFPAEPGWLWRRRHGAAIVTVGGQLAQLPASALTPERGMAGGVEGQLLAAPRGFPLLLGLGAGSLFLQRDRHTERGSWEWRRNEGWLIDDWTYSRASTTTVHSLQLRHAELLARFQPYWGTERPYLEGGFGVGILWDGTKVDGQVRDSTRSVGWLSSAALGVDLQLSPRSQRNGHLLIASLGARRLWSSTFSRTVDTASAGGAVTSLTTRGQLSLWMFTMALGLAY